MMGLRNVSALSKEVTSIRVVSLLKRIGSAKWKMTRLTHASYPNGGKLGWLLEDVTSLDCPESVRTNKNMSIVTEEVGNIFNAPPRSVLIRKLPMPIFTAMPH